MDYKNYSTEFTLILETEDKEKAVNYALDLLKTKKVDIVDLYTQVLTPSLSNIVCSLKEKHVCVWKEHVKTAIVRTIVECCFPYVIAKKASYACEKKGTAVVLCPPEEHHDLGARIVADYFTICGYQTIFVGSNTPYEDFFNVVDVIAPKIVAISVSNFYNIVITKKIVDELREKAPKSMKIVVGGYAFDSNSDNIEIVGADFYSQTFEDIRKISEIKASVERNNNL